MSTFNGTLINVDDTQFVSAKFKKREFVLTDASSIYPQDISFQLTQDKCSLADGFQQNDQIEVSFNIRGREWTSPQGEVKYFNTLEAWRIEKMGAGAPASAPSPMDGATNKATVDNLSNDSADDDLPF